MAPDLRLERWLRWREVGDLTGLGRTTAWRMRQVGDFPDPVQLSPGRVAWRERDIAIWNETRGVAGRLVKPSPGQRPSAPLSGRLEPEPKGIVQNSLRQIELKAAIETSSAAFAEKARTPRRRRPLVADGQLGFDF